MKSVWIATLAMALLTTPMAALALEFKSVGDAPAILYDAPSAKGRKVFIAPAGMPVEVVLVYEAWTKIRDAAGDLSWIESESLVPKRMVVTTVAGLQVRNAPEQTAGVVFTTDKGVLLEMLGPAASGWIKVRHVDGQDGFVPVAAVWGE